MDHNGHRQRMNDKFTEFGAEPFCDHEILEMLLFFPIARKNTNELAHALIERFGSFRGVFDAPYNELLSVEGVGEQTARYIKLIASVVNRYYSPKNDKRIVLNDVTKVEKYLFKLYAGESEEKFAVICLDPGMRVIKCDFLAKGNTRGVDVTISSVIRMVMDYSPSALIVAHNHPQSVAIPSSADIESTLKLNSILRYMDCTLIDHFVVSDSSCMPILNQHRV